MNYYLTKFFVANKDNFDSQKVRRHINKVSLQAAEPHIQTKTDINIKE